jgi:hypothetical protein
MGRKTKFWCRVISRGWEMTKNEVRGGIWSLFSLIILYLIVPVYSASLLKIRLEKINIVVPAQDNIIDELILGIMIVGMMLLIFGIVNFIKVPPKMYEELGGFIENPFIIEVYRSKREDIEDRDKWVSLKVHNKSTSENIEECYLRLDDIVDKNTNESIIEDVQKLTWSGREHNQIQSGKQPLLIGANDFSVCDVARTKIIRNEAYYTTWFGKQYIEPGEYKLTFSAFCTFRKHQKSYLYQAELSFDGKITIGFENPAFIKEHKNE